MKYRHGFVSNSSSTAFILDRRKLSPDVLHHIESLPDMDLLDRRTGSMTGDAQEFIDARRGVLSTWSDGWDDLNSVIAQYIGELGAENVIVVRESDEGMGGYLEDVGLCYSQIAELAEAEVEYH